ncbi:phosphotransferase family protein [Cellulomonas sp. PhB150]|uniref:phosphotransferase family protein n=1 Tax=Cellulomonas sp. PhB150 TaxID=2485188 RepID=UPI000FA23B67|nr:aminoglycoside phosphotransferase family protein [Cellulomonas sp. PhB150]ROS26094.1 phosphotransferase family enzyme [Cellulomonas sp. PhB150]
MTSTDALSRIVAPLGTLTSAELLTGGMFATTHRVTLEDGRRVIVKAAPDETDRLLTYEHDVLRTEALVYALADGRPELRMPTLLLTDFSRTLLPADVVVVSHLDGVPLNEAGFEPGDPRLMRVETELGAHLARQGTVTGPRFGYPHGPGLLADTWPEAFGLIVEALLADGRRWGTVLPDDEIRAAVARHADALAEVTTPRLVHTDLWPGNLFVDPASGELLGVIDPERAVWGDPLFDLVGSDAMWNGTSAHLLAGYAAEAGEPWAVDEPAAATRLLLYRVQLALVMLVEITPRAYEGDWLDEYVPRLRAILDRALAGLA